MKKLESFHDISSGKGFADNSQFERFYFELINPTLNKYGFIKPLQNLIDYRDGLARKGRILSFEYLFVSLFVKKFESIIFMKPQKMERVIRLMNFLGFTKKFYTKVNGETVFCKTLNELLRYNSAIGGGDRGKDLARAINIKSCLYCNAQYSFSYKYDSKRISKLQLDHFYSKSKYPYLSISLYNLIPTCSYCNQKKSNADFLIKSHSNPYIESFSDRFKFALSQESEKKLLLNYQIAEQDVEIILEHANDPKVNNHDEVFDLTGIYSNHKNIVIDILRKGKAYPKLKREQILDIKDEKGNKLFATEDDLKRLFFNMPLSDEEINQEPLAKLKRDFAIKAQIF